VGAGSARCTGHLRTLPPKVPPLLGEGVFCLRRGGQFSEQGCCACAPTVHMNLLRTIDVQCTLGAVHGRAHQLHQRPRTRARYPSRVPPVRDKQMDCHGAFPAKNVVRLARRLRPGMATGNVDATEPYGIPPRPCQRVGVTSPSSGWLARLLPRVARLGRSRGGGRARSPKIATSRWRRSMPSRQAAPPQRSGTPTGSVPGGRPSPSVAGLGWRGSRVSSAPRGGTIDRQDRQCSPLAVYRPPRAASSSQIVPRKEVTPGNWRVPKTAKGRQRVWRRSIPKGRPPLLGKC
jgi:hypothetical protein